VGMRRRVGGNTRRIGPTALQGRDVAQQWGGKRGGGGGGGHHRSHEECQESKPGSTPATHVLHVKQDVLSDVQLNSLSSLPPLFLEAASQRCRSQTSALCVARSLVEATAG